VPAFPSHRLVLASSSRYRRELLERLKHPFEVADPALDESRLPGESPSATAQRLALAKARAVQPGFPEALIIGSDQVAHSDGRVFGKPGTRERAVEQLHALSGRTVVFHTALCVLDAATGWARERAVPTEVRFRRLSEVEIERYVGADQPYDCAGSARSEGLGIGLLEYIRGDDPTALIGLPLIALCDLLRAHGLNIP
jgi:septum formation protein